MAAESQAGHVLVDDKLASTTIDASSTYGNVADTTMLVRKNSAHSLASSRSAGSQKPRWTIKSPLKVPPPVRSRPVVDRFGHPITLSTKLDETLWDKRHQLGCNENDLKPKLQRDYFSRPHTMQELVDHFENTIATEKSRLLRGMSDATTTPVLQVARSMLQTMSMPEFNDRKPSFITPDTAPPLVPIRHVVGGAMKDRDGLQRLWNDRWEKGIGLLNDNCHPDHRAYFTQNSLFEDSQSQRWRRYLDQKTYEFNREFQKPDDPRMPNDPGLQFGTMPWNSAKGQLVVQKVKKESWAMKNGILEGAMILSINSKPVASMNETDFEKAWSRRPLLLAIKQDNPVWTPIRCTKPHRFPPLGCRMHGRSGTPIPGATA
mmetsp:Transcript_108267/g.170715  ORF Transcript_108267/g.170715 Transcript_108267/m.170715 type:complete len:375 (-) Transcript_108267:68-1192(-)|eukprot:CAMPEP_0169120536 /NCGR_PEP_ID=MMETSP1015-20121227/32159_1 /TAXON_ID=342587 /ORGANISM="Karlodinium micrum, Strain CCMP2283" /LENGTH=374 /DNA_ID=CAMNT_0009183523 /DNA_START=62 /DNA_END=1189 /DNA_ORIENTATION=-